MILQQLVASGVVEWKVAISKMRLCWSKEEELYYVQWSHLKADPDKWGEWEGNTDDDFRCLWEAEAIAKDWLETWLWAYRKISPARKLNGQWGVIKNNMTYTQWETGEYDTKPEALLAAYEAAKEEK